MKRKITHVMLLLLTGWLAVMTLAGCGKIGGENNGDSDGKGNSSIESLLETEDAEKGIEGIAAEKMGEGSEVAGKKTGEAEVENGSNGGKELDWLTLEEKLRPCILQITCGGYTGSGVVWEVTEEKITVVTSGHLLKNGEVCDVICYAGIFYEAEVDGVLEDCDIGFAVIPAEALKEDGVELTAVLPYGRGKDALVQGEELAVYGSMDYVAGNFVKGYLIEAERAMLLDGYEKEEGLLLGGILKEDTENIRGGIVLPDGAEKTDGRKEEGAGEESDTDKDIPHGKKAGTHDSTADAGAGEAVTAAVERGAVDAGMSGSGVFNRRGELVGILAGGDGKAGFAAVPVWKFTEGGDA